MSPRFLQHFVVLTSCIAMLLRIAYRTFFQTTAIVLMMAPNFVETAKWHYAKTVIELAWRPLCKSFQWELQMIISGVILATCYIPFKFVGLKLLFACQLGQRSQQASSFFFRNGDMEACIVSRSSKMVNNICQLNSLKSFWIETVICMIAESTVTASSACQ